MITESDAIIKGIFLLILAISGNFIAETLGCKTQKLLKENMVVKHIVIFLIIYFVLGFTSDEKLHPLDIGKNALFIWILFVLFTRMSLFFTIIVFILITFRYIISLTIEYYKEKEENSEFIESLKLMGDNMVYVIVVLILVGFILYTRKQYSEYYKDWSTYKFVFGVNKCKSIK